MEIKGKHVLAAIAVLAIVGGLIQAGYINVSTTFGQNIGTSTYPQTTVTTDNNRVTQIIAISSVNLKATFTDALNETTEFVNPTFYVWREGAKRPTAQTVSNGQATVQLRPYEKITYAAGSDGSLYWVKDEFQMGATDSALEVELYQVAGSNDVTIKVFDDSYNDLSGGNYNISVGAGQDFNIQVIIDDVGEYTAVRAPVLCVDYDTSVINKVKIAGLKQVDAPTRLVSGLDQCFDLGIDMYLYNNPKMTYDVSVDVLPSVNPSNSAMTFYLIDRDIWYMDGNLYMVNPLDNSNMGSTSDTTNWKTTIYLQ